MKLIPEDFMNAVVSIGVRKNDSVTWIATGFFITKLINNKNKMTFLVTNKHVFESVSSVVIRLIDKKSGDPRELDLGLFTNHIQNFIVHSNSVVDIAVVYISKAFISDNNFEFSAFDIDAVGTSSDQLKQDFGEGSPVYMLGYPLGCVDVDSNTPICRSGCIARIGKNEFAKTQSFLLDIQIFPGNSGGPVVTKPELISEGGEIKLSKSVLLGIVHSYMFYEESLINPQTKEIVGIRSGNSRIALVHPIELVEETIDQFIKCLLFECRRIISNNNPENV